MTWYLDVDRKAILQAIKEFNKLGRDEFLENYKFHYARDYFISHDGQKYDCKPIVYAAYKHQFGIEPSNRESSGVKDTIRPKLEEMGFTVINIRRQPS